MDSWKSELCDRMVSVVTRNGDDEWEGQLLSADTTPLQHGVGPTVVLRGENDNTIVLFDVESIEELVEVEELTE